MRVTVRIFASKVLGMQEQGPELYADKDERYAVSRVDVSSVNPLLSSDKLFCHGYAAHHSSFNDTGTIVAIPLVVDEHSLIGDTEGVFAPDI
jgi:hypothetical protein